jgi:hypothetical protein
MNFTIFRDDGTPRALISVFQNYGDSYCFQLFWPSDNIRDATTRDWIDLFKQGFEYVRSQGAKEVLLRVINEPELVGLIQELPGLGFSKSNDRIEYRAELSLLPSENGSPIVWEAMEPMGPWTEKSIINLLKEVGRGDPDFDVENEDIEAVFKGYLNDKVLTNNPDCVHVGLCEGKAAALVVAQINPKTGWSRIMYMGIIPTFRGKGLGTWVHRHGFEMMKAQGGTLYHGGTLVQNKKMIKLFLSNGCKEYRSMQEWACKL